MKNNEYADIVDKVLKGMLLDLDDDKKAFIVERLSVVNKMVILANDGNTNYGLRSTQVICKIIDDCLTQLNITWFI